MIRDHAYLRDAFNNNWVKALRTMKSDLWWLLLVFLLFVPMLIDFVYLNDYLPILRSTFPFWSERSAIYILSDILFFEAGFFLIFGAAFAGAVLYIAWSPGWMSLFVDPVFHWKIVKREREIPASLVVGLIIIAIGMVYILAAIIITL
jgi:hypothetical protein